MNAICYEFDSIPIHKHNNYILQYVQNRILTDICHSHDFYEVVYIIEGECTQVINGTTYHLNKNDISILRPFESHFFTEQSDDVEVISLSVKKEEFERLFRLYDTPEKILSDQNTFLFNSTQSAIKFKNFLFAPDENDCKLLLCAIINMYLHAAPTKDKIPANLLYAVSEIKKTENLKIGVPAFIKFSNYSQSQLARLMKKHFNTNIHDYIMHLRLDKAYNDIIFTRIRLEEIAESVGYASFSHFNKIFKKRYDISPAALRKLHSKSTI